VKRHHGIICILIGATFLLLFAFDPPFRHTVSLGNFRINLDLVIAIGLAAYGAYVVATAPENSN
jgi:hypothetical protein